MKKKKLMKEQGVNVELDREFNNTKKVRQQW